MNIPKLDLSKPVAMSPEEWKELATVEELTPRWNELLDKTEKVDEHPEDYDGPCVCKLCCSYGD